MLKDTLSEPY